MALITEKDNRFPLLWKTAVWICVEDNLPRPISVTCFFNFQETVVFFVSNEILFFDGVC